MKNILMIIPELGSGGAQRSFCNLSNELNKQYRVTNVVFNGEVKHAYTLDGELISLAVKGGGNLFTKGFNFMRRVRRLRQLKTKLQTEVSISFLEGADYINILSKGKEKVVISIRGSKLHDGNIQGLMGSLRKRFLIPLLYRRAQAIVAVNTGILSELDNSFNLTSVKKLAIPNFYDHTEILAKAEEALPEPLCWLREEKYLVISSRLAREKNIEAMIGVFAELKRMGYAGKLLIVGGGPLESLIPEICHDASLRLVDASCSNPSQCDVLAVGPAANPFIYMRHASCFLMASESEGFPNSLLEAMVLGVPVISSDCPWGPGEILDPSGKRVSVITQPFMAHFGILMPELSNNMEDIQKWSKWLIKILGDEGLLNLYRRRAQEGASIYTKERAMEMWEEVLGGL